MKGWLQVESRELARSDRLDPVHRDSKDMAPAEPRTIVVKVGTSSILRGDTGQLALSTLAALVETLTTMVKAGHCSAP